MLLDQKRRALLPFSRVPTDFPHDCSAVHKKKKAWRFPSLYSQCSYPHNLLPQTTRCCKSSFVRAGRESNTTSCNEPAARRAPRWRDLNSFNTPILQKNQQNLILQNSHQKLSQYSRPRVGACSAQSIAPWYFFYQAVTIPLIFVKFPVLCQGHQRGAAKGAIF